VRKGFIIFINRLGAGLPKIVEPLCAEGGPLEAFLLAKRFFLFFSEIFLAGYDF